MKSKVLIVIVLIYFILYSCKTNVEVIKSNRFYQFSGIFDNNAFKVKGRRYGSPTLLELFEIYHIKTDSVTIKCDSVGNLKLIFVDNKKNITEKTVKGSYSKKGYLEIFLRYESKGFPPFIPIIYGKYNINKIRLSLTTNGDLVVNNKWIEGGHIFIFGIGDSGKRRSYFKRRK